MPDAAFAQNVQSMQATRSIIDAIRANPKVPAPSQAVFKILELTRDENCDLKKVAQAISRDGGLTAQILRQANSALYGFDKPTSAPNEACMRLGLKRVRAAVINQHVVNGLSSARPPGFEASRYWQSAFAISVGAREICQQLAPADADDAGTAGLLCDIGVGLLAFGAPSQYQPVLARACGPAAMPLPQLERTLLGVTHADVGAAILSDWKLDDRIIEAVRAHHSDACEGGYAALPKLAKIVAAAVVLSEIALNGSDMERVGELFARVEGLAPEPDRLVTRLLDKLVANIQETARTLAVEIGSVETMQANFDALAGDIPDVGARLSFRPMKSPDAG